jgi:hypothetical protein
MFIKRYTEISIANDFERGQYCIITRTRVCACIITTEQNMDNLGRNIYHVLYLGVLIRSCFGGVCEHGYIQSHCLRLLRLSITNLASFTACAIYSQLYVHHCC